MTHVLVVHHDPDMADQESDWLLASLAAGCQHCQAHGGFSLALLGVDPERIRTGARVSGTARPFSEMKLHLAVYARRADVNAVVHAHHGH